MGMLTKEQKLKTSITFSLSLLSLVLLFVFPSLARALCLAAMLFSSLGDLLLMNFTPLTKHIRGNLFLIGASSFGVAHVFYIATYALKAFNASASLNTGTFFAVIIAVTTMLILFSISNVKKSVEVKMLIFGLAYIAVLSVNMLFVFSYAVQVKGFAFFTALGAFSFFFSDSVIAFNTVLKVKVGLLQELLIWIPYVIGQLLLIIGV